jgi:D-lactate dehydrogenase (cytochrome)
MPTHRIRARAPREPIRPPRILRGEEVAVYLQDAAHTPGGFTPLVALPETEGEVAHLLRDARAVLPVGAQSSLTGGATPFGEWVLSLSRMSALGPIRDRAITVQAGAPLVTLAEAIREEGLYYPPAPTFLGATVGGTASTNAAGAATFKYGTTREWIQSLTVVLADGDVLDLARGECRAHPDGYFEVQLTPGETRRIPLPTYRLPDVPKRSAGYHAEPSMDLVDLFVGSEGTLGVITEVELRLIEEPCRFLGWVGFESEARALELVGRLREASRATWTSRDPRGIDIASIESMDRRCLELLREEGKDRENGVRLESGVETAILFGAELSTPRDKAAALLEISALDDPEPPDTPLIRLLRLFEEHDALGKLELALPGDRRRSEQFQALREAVPIAVNHRVAAVQRTRDPKVQKTAADMIVPFEHLGAMMDAYREGFGARGLDHALWGHISDGNIHANVIPRSAEDVAAGDAAILEFGLQAVRFGGCPLSEHGVGRSRVKQALLRQLYGEAGVEEMRRVKKALDPDFKLSPGVLFSRRAP